MIRDEAEKASMLLKHIRDYELGDSYIRKLHAKASEGNNQQAIL